MKYSVFHLKRKGQLPMKVLVVNPGATSTKIAVFEETEQLFKLGIDHSAEELDRFERVFDQADYRRDAILTAVNEAGYQLSDFDAVCGRGGLYRPIPSGTYAVSDAVLADVEAAPYGEHPSNLGAYIARRLADMVGIPSFFVDPVCVDEMTEIAHYTGFAPFRRLCQFHALNHKSIGRKAAEKLGADMVATGHYCRKDVLEDGSCRILEGSDPNKDQSYFLCQLNQHQLSKALFPIGDILKPEVRRLAKEAELPSAEKKDSQGICFVGKVDLPVFLQQKLKSVEGEVVEVFDAYYADCAKYARDRELLERLRNGGLSDEELFELSQPLDYKDLVFETESYRSGKKHVKKTRYKANPWGAVIGRHEGAQFYTIGQRKGLGIGGHANPVFVLATDIGRNVIFVGEGESHKGMTRSCLRVAPDEIHWIRPSLAMSIGEERRYRVRIRYRQPLQDATLMMRENGLYIVFDQPQRSITAGQFAVWYAPDGEMVGSGVI